jgi:hypothetical protein
MPTKPSSKSASSVTTDRKDYPIGATSKALEAFAERLGPAAADSS